MREKKENHLWATNQTYHETKASVNRSKTVNKATKILKNGQNQKKYHLESKRQVRKV